MFRLLFSSLLFFLLLTGCGKDDAEQKPSSPQTESQAPATIEPALKLEQVSFNDLKGFAEDNKRSFYRAWKRSCAAVSRQKKSSFGTAEISISTKEYQKICAALLKIKPEDLDKFIVNNFTPYRVTYNGSDEGKFTSYYEAALNASRTQSDVYRFPVYGLPEDLVEVNLKDFDSSLPARNLVGRVNGQKLVPYYDRAQIMQQDYKAPVILWTDDYVDLYIMQIQGSAVAELDDGSQIRIGFAGTNGKPFKGIGSILLEKGLISTGQASMGGIKKWLKQQGEKAYPHMNDNQRFVFHRLVDSDGPIGAQGVPLTAGRSIAVDNNFIPLGSLLWLETTGPNKEPLRKMVIAQDIGGAIKGAIRGDYFWGSGHDDVLELAGKMNSSGRYFILLPKEDKHE